MSYVRNNGMKILMTIWTIAMVASIGSVKAEEIEGGGNKGVIYLPSILLSSRISMPTCRSRMCSSSVSPDRAKFFARPPASEFRETGHLGTGEFRFEEQYR